MWGRSLQDTLQREIDMSMCALHGALIFIQWHCMLRKSHTKNKTRSNIIVYSSSTKFVGNLNKNKNF